MLYTRRNVLLDSVSNYLLSQLKTTLELRQCACPHINVCKFGPFHLIFCLSAVNGVRTYLFGTDFFVPSDPTSI